MGLNKQEGQRPLESLFVEETVPNNMTLRSGVMRLRNTFRKNYTYTLYTFRTSVQYFKQNTFCQNFQLCATTVKQRLLNKIRPLYTEQALILATTEKADFPPPLRPACLYAKYLFTASPYKNKRHFQT